MYIYIYIVCIHIGIYIYICKYLEPLRALRPHDSRVLQRDPHWRSISMHTHTHTHIYIYTQTHTHIYRERDTYLEPLRALVLRLQDGRVL